MSYTTSTSASFALTVGQSVAVRTQLSEGAKVRIQGASADREYMVNDANSKTFGPFTEAKTVTVGALYGAVEYDYGAAPNLPAFVYQTPQSESIAGAGLAIAYGADRSVSAESMRVLANSGVSPIVSLATQQPLFVPLRGFAASPSWKNFGGSQQAAQVNISNGVLSLRGRLNLTSGTAANGNIADLPNGFNTGAATEAAQAAFLPTTSAQDLASLTINPTGIAASGNLPAMPTVQGTFGTVIPSTPAVYVLDINTQFKAAGGVAAAAYQRNASVNDDVAILFSQQALQDGYPKKAVFFFHGASDDYLSHISSPVSATSSQRLAANLMNALYADGWSVLSSSGGSITDHWGNPQSWSATQAALAGFRAKFPNTKIVAIGQSMGGLSSLRALAYDSLGITNWAGVYPVCNLQSIYNGGSYTTPINTAHGGSGGFAANVGSCDPMQFPTALFAGKKMLAYHSAGDTAVPKASNSDALAAKVTGTAASVSVVATTGNHGDTSNWTSAVATAIVAHLNT